MVSQAAAECKIDEAGHRDDREREREEKAIPWHVLRERAMLSLVRTHWPAGWLYRYRVIQSLGGSTTLPIPPQFVSKMYVTNEEVTNCVSVLQ